MPIIESEIIPLREKTGNYDYGNIKNCDISNYTTTRENRELRPLLEVVEHPLHYTTTRENRELRHASAEGANRIHYTTTRENRELRPLRVQRI